MKNYLKDIKPLRKQQEPINKKILEIKSILEREIDDYIQFCKKQFPKYSTWISNDNWMKDHYDYMDEGPILYICIQQTIPLVYKDNKNIYFHFDLNGEIEVSTNFSRNDGKPIRLKKYKFRSKVKIKKLITDWVLFCTEETKRYPKI